VQSAWITKKHSASASAMAPHGRGATPFHQCWWSTPEGTGPPFPGSAIPTVRHSRGPPCSPLIPFKIVSFRA